MFHSSKFCKMFFFEATPDPKRSLFPEVIILDFSMLKKSGDFSNPYLEVQNTVGKSIVTRVFPSL